MWGIHLKSLRRVRFILNGQVDKQNKSKAFATYNINIDASDFFTMILMITLAANAENMPETGTKGRFTTYGAILFVVLVLCIGAGALYAPDKGLISVLYTGIVSISLVMVLWYIRRIDIKALRILFIFLIVILTTILISLSIFFIGYYYTNEATIADNYSVLAIFQSDIGEIISYIFENAAIWQTLIFFILFLLPFILMYLFYTRLPMKAANSTPKNLLWSSLVLGILAFTTFIPVPGLASTSFFYKQFQSYKAELATFKKVQAKFNATDKSINGYKKESGETYVVVIGESLSKEHMQIYGYPRETTPQIASMINEGTVIKYENAISNHTHTTQTLSKALTSSNQYNQQTFPESKSIINILNAADIETYWISNQVRYGVWDNAVGIVADNSDHKYYYNKYIGKTFKNKNNDEIVLKDFKKVLSKTSSNNRVIFVHLIGNHWKYSERYTDTFDTFNTPHDPGVLGREPELYEIINHYDNSVKYNDYVVSELIDILSKAPEKVKGLVYMADHSEDVWGGKNHQSSKFTYTMVEIPMIFWLSKEYQRTHSSKYNNLIDKKTTHWTNDLFYDMLIGMIGVEVEDHDPVMDITSPLYNLPLEEIVTLHRKREYATDDNPFYITERNIDSLRNAGQLERVIPHRVNTHGKLHEVLYQGYNAYEIDALIIPDDNAKPRLEVGHDRKAMSGKNLESFILKMKTDQPAKIWLDIKNLSPRNLQDFQSILASLESHLPIKEAAIVESKMVAEDFKFLAEAGYHTSYYIPTNIHKISDPARLHKKAVAIASQVKKQRVSAVSFDYRMYPFVKKYLEDKLPNEMQYHLWDLTLNIKKTDFYDDLKKKSYYNDERVQTILFSYPTKFDL